MDRLLFFLAFRSVNVAFPAVARVLFAFDRSPHLSVGSFTAALFLEVSVKRDVLLRSFFFHSLRFLLYIRRSVNDEPLVCGEAKLEKLKLLLDVPNPGCCC